MGSRQQVFSQVEGGSQQALFHRNGISPGKQTLMTLPLPVHMTLCSSLSGISRAVAAVLLCPVLLVKTRMEYAPSIAK